MKTSEREREWAIANTGDLFQGSSTLALCPRLQHYEGFSLKLIPLDTRCRNSYNKFTLELQTCKSLTCSRKNNTRKHTNLPRPHLLQLLQLHVRTLGDHFTWSPQTLLHRGHHLYNTSQFKYEILWSLLLITKITLTTKIPRGLK